MNIRNVKLEDIDHINNIHNQAINEKFKVAYLTPWTNDMMSEWFKEHDSKEYPAYVAEIDNTAIGYVYIDSYRPGRVALKQTAEISYFVDKNYRRMGIGKKLISGGLIPRRSAAVKTGGAGDLFPRIRKDSKVKSSIPRGSAAGIFYLNLWNHNVIICA